MFRYLFGLLILTLAFGCTGSEDDGVGELTETFDRGAMLAGWMDDVIIPSHRATLDRLSELQGSLSAYDPATRDTLIWVQHVRDFQLASEAFERQSPFIGPEGEAVRLREQSNTYPADTEQIKANLEGEFNLALPSSVDVQGFPALEYLLFAKEDGAAKSLIDTEPAAREYAVQLVARMIELQETTLTALENNRDAYVANDGNSATASVDRTVNDFVFYYEKFLRAGKVGIPAGVFSDMPLPDRAQGLYDNRSGLLFNEALTATEDFILAKGLADYLDALAIERNGEPLSQLIQNQFSAIRAAARGLNNNYSIQVQQDNRRMLQLYDELQKLTILLKVDMLQALNINVDYTDADGD